MWALLSTPVVTAVTPPSIGDLFAPVGTGVLDSIQAILPVAIPVFVLLAGVSIAIAVFRKFGVRR